MYKSFNVSSSISSISILTELVYASFLHSRGSGQTYRRPRILPTTSGLLRNEVFVAACRIFVIENE